MKANKVSNMAEPHTYHRAKSNKKNINENINIDTIISEKLFDRSAEHK